MNDNDLRQMQEDVKKLRDVFDDETLAEMLNRKKEFLEEIKRKPKTIESNHSMGTLIDAYDITATQASDILHRIDIGELKTEKDIKAHVEKHKKDIQQVEDNKNKGGEKK